MRHGGQRHLGRQLRHRARPRHDATGARPDRQPAQHDFRRIEAEEVMGCPIGQKSFKNPSLKSLKNHILGDFLFDFNKISCEAIP